MSNSRTCSSALARPGRRAARRSRAQPRTSPSRRAGRASPRRESRTWPPPSRRPRPGTGAVRSGRPGTTTAPGRGEERIHVGLADRGGPVELGPDGAQAPAPALGLLGDEVDADIRAVTVSPPVGPLRPAPDVANRCGPYSPGWRSNAYCTSRSKTRPRIRGSGNRSLRLSTKPLPGEGTPRDRRAARQRDPAWTESVGHGAATDEQPAAATDGAALPPAAPRGSVVRSAVPRSRARRRPRDGFRANRARG